MEDGQHPNATAHFREIEPVSKSVPTDTPHIAIENRTALRKQSDLIKSLGKGNREFTCSFLANVIPMLRNSLSKISFSGIEKLDL